MCLPRRTTFFLLLETELRGATETLDLAVLNLVEVEEVLRSLLEGQQLVVVGERVLLRDTLERRVREAVEVTLDRLAGLLGRATLATSLQALTDEAGDVVALGRVDRDRRRLATDLVVVLLDEVTGDVRRRGQVDVTDVTGELGEGRRQRAVGRC